MGGFELLALYDFPGQGTAPVGVLDAFWNSKGYITAREFRRFCNSTVPLVRLPKRVFTGDEEIVAGLEAAHFGPEPLGDVKARLSLVREDGQVVISNVVSSLPAPVGDLLRFGGWGCKLGTSPLPARYKLVMSLEGTPFENDWDLWVYPATVDTRCPPNVKIVSQLDARAETVLRAGGRVLLLVPPGKARGDRLGKVQLGFSPIFWNTSWTRRQPPHTLGILCDPKHPALADFPTESHANWQWWYLLSRADALILDDLPRNLRPVVQVIDDWITNRKLGLIVEARVGSGRLLVCSIDLETNLKANPVARQLRAACCGTWPATSSGRAWKSPSPRCDQS